ncbi:MAG: FecR domain-containing protein, partial [Deltaproteobacteria bacterium]
MQTSPRAKLLFIVGIIGLTTIMCSTSGDAEPAAEPITAIISEISGQVQVLKPQVGALKDADLGQGVEVNDQVLTHNDSRARIDLSTGTIIRMSPLTTFVMAEAKVTASGPYARLKMEVGKIWIILNGGTLDVDTPTGKASVRGSYLQVWVNKDTRETVITCLEGECSLGNDAGTVRLTAGESASVTNTDAAPTPGEMNDENVAEWLAINPEATMVIVPLTETVAARADENEKATPPTATFPPLAFPTNTPAPTDLNCGPPNDWVVYSVQSGDTVDDLADTFRVSEADLRHANCFG